MIEKPKIYINSLTFLTSKMNEIIEIKTVTITEKGQICIPNSARSLKCFKEGTKIGIIVYENKIELRPLKQIKKGMEYAIASEKALEEDWNSPEDEKAWKNL